MSRRMQRLWTAAGWMLFLQVAAAYGLGTGDDGGPDIPLQRMEVRTIGRMNVGQGRFHPTNENRILIARGRGRTISEAVVAWYDLRDGGSEVLFDPRQRLADLADYSIYNPFIMSQDLALVGITDRHSEVVDGKTFSKASYLTFLLDLQTGAVRPAQLPVSFSMALLVQSTQDRTLFVHRPDNNRTFSFWDMQTGTRTDWVYPPEVQKRFTGPAVICPGFHPGELYVHSMSREDAAEVFLVSAAESKVLRAIALPPEINRLMHGNAAERMALSPDGRYLVLNHHKYGVWLLDLRNERYTTLIREADGRSKEPVFLDWAWGSNLLLLKVGGVVQVVRILNEE